LDDLEETHGSTIGTIRYLAPEVTRFGKWSPSSDVYAFGLLLFEMLHGELVFSGLSSMQCALATAQGRRPEMDLPFYLTAAKELIVSCWAVDVTSRPSMQFIREGLCTILKNVVVNADGEAERADSGEAERTDS